MAFNQGPLFTDEEIVDELHKLGYNEVPPDVLQMMKQDLLNLVDSEQSFQTSSSSHLRKPSNPKMEIFSHSIHSQDVNRDSLDASPLHDISPNINASLINRERRTQRRILSLKDLETESGYRQFSGNKSQSAGGFSASSPLTRYRLHRNGFSADSKRYEISPRFDSLSDDRSQEGISSRRFDTKQQDSDTESVPTSDSASQGDVVTCRDTSFTGMQHSVISRDTPLIGQHNSVTCRDSPLIGLHHTVTSRDTHLTGMQQSVTCRDTPLTGPQHSVTCRDTPLTGLQHSQGRRLSKVEELDVNTEDNQNASISEEDVSPSNISLSKYKNCLENYKRNKDAKRGMLSNVSQNSSISTLESSFGSMSINGKLKRKVLRQYDGERTVTEELIDIPNIFNSSYPSTLSFNSSKSFSSANTSWKSNSSTGSLVALSPETSLTPRSTLSLSNRSRFRNPPRKKKNDPVAMYNYYKKFWDNFEPPGVKTHDRLRWAVRDKMLDYNL